VAATIHIAETLRRVVAGLPSQKTIEIRESKTLRQAAVEVGVPPILIVFAVVDGARKGLDEPLNDGVQVHFHGTMAGG
jgi:molybdopterin converting factor small subunit